MHRTLARHRRLTLVLLLALGSFLLFAGTALAQDEAIVGDSVASGDTVERDVLLNGTNVALDGIVIGDALLLGQTVVINGEVQGSAVIIAENVIMNGQVENSVYAAAVSFSMLADSQIGRSLYFAGISLVTERAAEIGRDLFAAAMGARLAGNVARDTNAIIGLVEIGRQILNSVNDVTTSKEISALQPSPAATQAVGMPLFAASLGPVGGPAGHAQALPAAQDDTGDVEPETTSSALEEYFLHALRELISLLVVGGLLIWLAPGWLARWAEQLRRRPLASGGWGLVAYIVGFVGAVIALVVVVAIGISLAAVTLWGLAWTWWALGLFALGLAFSLFLLAIAYVSKVIVAYVVGDFILRRFGARSELRKPWPLLLGLVIYVLLCGLPYLGWAVALLASLLGLGAIWLSFLSRGNDSGTAPLTA